MQYRTFASINIALIGTGAVAEAYARRYAGAGHVVLMAWKDGEQGVSPELAALENIHVCSIEEAALLADMIIIATSPVHVREVAYWLGDVRKKVIIDATANMHVENDGLVTTICAISAITGSPHVVKVFSTRGYEQLLKPLFGHENVQLIMVGDSVKAKEVVKILTIELGVHLFFDMGGNDVRPLFNEMTSAWRKLARERNNALAPTVSVKI